MTDQITLEKALKLVSFGQDEEGHWRVFDVNGDLYGSVHGGVYGEIYGDVGYVYGTIHGRKWQFVETPKEKLQRLLDGASEEELLKLINQMENN